MFAWNHKRKKKDTTLREVYSDTLELDISFDVPVRPMDAKGLIVIINFCFMNVSGLANKQRSIENNDNKMSKMFHKCVGL